MLQENDITLKGFVTTGRGNARGDFEHLRGELSTVTGQDLIDGSLNLRLTAPILLCNDRATRVDYERRLLWPAEINGQRVWVYRFWDQPLHFFEILASVHLRACYGLKDGDAVEVTLRSADVQPLDRKRAVMWWLLWRFREPWAYTNDFYFHSTRALAGDLGLTQRTGVGSVGHALRRFGRRIADRLRQRLFSAD